MKKALGIVMAAFLVMGLAGPASAGFDYGNLHFVAIEDINGGPRHDSGDGTYEYHVDLGDFNVLATGTGPGQGAGMVDFPFSIDTGMTVGDFDATSWDDIYFGGYGLDALWFNFGAGLTETTAAGSGVVFLSAQEVSSDDLGSSSGTNIINLFDGTMSVQEGQLEMTASNSYLTKNSYPETGNYNAALDLGGFPNAELNGLGDMFLYGFDKNDKTTLTKLSDVPFTLSEDATDGSLVVSQVPVPGAVWLLGSGLLGFFGIRRKKA